MGNRINPWQRPRLHHRRGRLRFCQIHLDFYTSPLIHGVAVDSKPEAPLDQPAVADVGTPCLSHFPSSRTTRNGHAPHKLLVRTCIEQLMPNPMLRVQTPSTAEVTVTEQAGRKIVHLLHYPSQRRGTDIDMVEDIIPLFNIPLSVKASRRPRPVYLAPGLQTLSWSFDSGYIQLSVPEVYGYAMVVVED